jgi:hypothetical protein
LAITRVATSANTLLLAARCAIQRLGATTAIRRCRHRWFFACSTAREGSNSERRPRIGQWPQRSMKRSQSPE